MCYVTGVSHGGWVADGGRREYGVSMEGQWDGAVAALLEGPPDRPTDAGAPMLLY